MLSGLTVVCTYMARFKEFAFKKFGYLDFKHNFSELSLLKDLDPFIKIAFVRSGGLVRIDFQNFQLAQDAFFFISPGQYYRFDNSCRGTMLYYNRDFYCIEIHDKEVACDGILFHNVYDIPVVYINADNSSSLENLLTETYSEMSIDDNGTEEMLRILLKQLIIKCTRIWKQEHHQAAEQAKPEVEFSRTFSQLIDFHYTRRHSVAEYADLLNITPKALNKRITQFSRITPNDLIKNRIMLEAKRLLAHTSLTIKEIAYKLGYDDSSYFIRFFTKQEILSPQKFRLQYQSTPKTLSV